MALDTDVRLVDLEPFSAVSFHGYGEQPEAEAWDQVAAWIDRLDTDDAFAPHRFFGFNDPDPTEGRSEYGYRQWVTIPEGWRPTGDVETVEFEGGRYLVARCEGLANLGEAWEDLWAWARDHHHEPGAHQWLEEVLTPFETEADAYVVDLYFPVS